MTLSQVIQEKLEYLRSHVLITSYRMASEIVDMLDEHKQYFPTDFIITSECPNNSVGFFAKDWPVSTAPANLYPPVPYIHILERNDRWYIQCPCCDGKGNVTRILTVGELSNVVKQMLHGSWWQRFRLLFFHSFSRYAGERCGHHFRSVITCLLEPEDHKRCCNSHTISLSIKSKE
jgi:hypothetical protein